MHNCIAPHLLLLDLIYYLVNRIKPLLLFEIQIETRTHIHTNISENHEAIIPSVA